MDLPGILVNVTLSYRFGTGTKTDRLNQVVDGLITLPKKGF